MTTKHQPMTRLDDCQDLLVSQIHATLTNVADHTDAFSHTMVTRFWAQARGRPSALGDTVPPHVILPANGFLGGDDPVLATPCSPKIALVRRQWSSHAQAISTGMGSLPGARGTFSVTKVGVSLIASRPCW